MKKRARYTLVKDLRCKAKSISMLILDVDGVLTDGGIVMDEKGKELKVFSVRDGTGATLWNRAGFKLGIISGRTAKAVKYRAEQMHAVFLYQGKLRKLEPYNEIKKKYHLKDSEIAYIGDDLHDIPIMKRAGLSIAVVEVILKAKGLWDKVTERYYE